MTRYAERYPELDQFLGCYFHQSWPEDHELTGAPFDAIVRYFQVKNPAATVRQTIRELEDFLSLELSEKELRDVLVHDFTSLLPRSRAGTHVPSMAGSDPGYSEERASRNISQPPSIDMTTALTSVPGRPS